jgi:acetylornithine deacetylase/succinyl-diaminopimelate desuccinylase-like protein
LAAINLEGGRIMSWTRRRFLVTGGRAAAGMAATAIAAPLLIPDMTSDRLTASTEGAAEPIPEDLDPVALAVAMIRFDTSHNGEGGVTLPHARWFAAKWAAAGIETEIIPTPKPDNVHCIARLRGTGAAAPLLYLGHSDVVSVERERWTVDPYAGEIRDGFLYGRGAIDMKGANAATMAALLRHLSEGAQFDRDIIFLSDCDEEAGPYAARWLAANHWDKVDAGAVLTEGGWFLAQGDGRSPMLATLTCQDKVFALVSVSAAGTTTHSSRPQPDSAILRLNRAIARLGDYQPDVFVGPLVRRHFEALADATDDPLLSRAVRLMLKAKNRNERNRAGEVVVSRSPYPWLHNALLRPTVAYVIENGGYRSNIIPGGATMTINLRLLPGGPGVAQIVDEMRDAIGDDHVTVAHIGALAGETPEAADIRVAAGIASVPSPYPEAGHPGDPTGVFVAWEAAVSSVFPGVQTTPTLFEAGTATGAWRAKGIPVYGVYPYVIDDDTLERMHGNDERVGVDALRGATDLMYALFRQFRV